MFSKYLFCYLITCLSLNLFACDSTIKKNSVSLTEWRIGILPDQSKEHLAEIYQPLTEYITQETGIKGRLIIPATYSALLNSFYGGDVNIALFGGVTFVRAHLEDDARPIALRNVDLKFSSVVLAQAKSRASSLHELEGLKFGFGSKLSTSGYMMPIYFFREMGIEPEKFFGEIIHSETHEETALKVQNGEVFAGVINSGIVQSMFETGELDQNKVKMLWQSPTFADYVWAANSSVPDNQAAAFRKALLNLNIQNPEHEILLNKLGAQYYLPASREDFIDLIDIVKSLNFADGE